MSRILLTAIFGLLAFGLAAQVEYTGQNVADQAPYVQPS